VPFDGSLDWSSNLTVRPDEDTRLDPTDEASLAAGEGGRAWGFLVLEADLEFWLEIWQLWTSA